MSNETEPSMGLIIGTARRVILKELQSVFIEHEIPLTIEQYIFIYSLNQLEGEITQQDMANLICKDKSAILRTIDVLEEQGLVMRHNDNVDRRKKTLTITEKCNKILEDVSVIEKQMMDRLRKGISDEDYQAMVRVMTQIQDNANNKNK
ncbi:MarR family transcriptional regulator [Pedobacter sp. P351]|uniref:MarR family winged helix-turn-helix transcriptional regulator n=1 Tax=Pedobacter superstes TaxID=3133441 RepID=UPI0030992FCC